VGAGRRVLGLEPRGEREARLLDLVELLAARDLDVAALAVALERAAELALPEDRGTHDLPVVLAGRVRRGRAPLLVVELPVRDQVRRGGEGRLLPLERLERDRRLDDRREV